MPNVPSRTHRVAHDWRSLRFAIVTLGLAALLAACGGRSGGEQPTAGPSTPASTTGPGTAASDVCGILTQDEAAEALGTTAEPGQVAGPLGTGCQWEAELGDAFLMMQKVPFEYFEEAGADGSRELEGIGEYAYVGPHVFGRVATARTADAGYIVIAAEPIDDEILIELLKIFVDRGAAVTIDGGGIDSSNGGEPVEGGG